VAPQGVDGQGGDMVGPDELEDVEGGKEAGECRMVPYEGEKVAAQVVGESEDAEAEKGQGKREFVGLVDPGEPCFPGRL